MSKDNFSIVEVNSNGYGDLNEIAIITVDANTSDILAVSYMKIANESTDASKVNKEEYTLHEAMTTLLKLIDGKKIASHTGLDFEHVYLNKLIKKTHGIHNLIERVSVIDTHVLSMKYLKGVKKDMASVAGFFGVTYHENPSALQKAFTTYGIIKNLFAKSAVRQHTYKYSFKPIEVPEIAPVPQEPRISRVVTTIEVHYN